ncbi:MAG: class I SAM-dependent methyltransferase [Polyangiaceae bacterium]|nr:class I SAM-dependent methyltransferase [Polyangiaceae bacterium]
MQPRFEILRQWAGFVKLAPILLAMARPVYRFHYLSAACSSGLLEALRDGPLSLSALAEKFGATPDWMDALEAWLDVGIATGELERQADGRFALKGYLAKALARTENAPFAAIVEEVGILHQKLVVETPDRLRSSRRFTLADQNARVIAQSSRILEPWVSKAVERAIPPNGQVKLLEVGCGSGIYMRHAATRNPALTALGLELQEGAADLARSNLQSWGLSDRMSVEVGDIRRRAPSPSFHIVTLHNNIYYFPVAERVELFRHLRGFLEPGGTLLATTACKGGSPAVEALNLWAAATEGCGRLPSPNEMVRQMEEAGFTGARSTKLIPFESYYSFTGHAP